MGFKALELNNVYSSESHDILHEFYIPVLTEAIKYNRMSSYFSSKSLAVAAKGILNLIKNDGNMKLITSPMFTKEDIKVLKDVNDNPQKYISDNILEDLNNLDNDFTIEHLKALGWMIANKKLVIKIAIPIKQDGTIMDSEEFVNLGLFHPKVGILEDEEGNILSFSGSINETGAGWMKNIEEFKVFKGWNVDHDDFMNEDINRFNRVWNGLTNKLKVINLPKAVKNHLIEIAPENIESVNLNRFYISDKSVIFEDNVKKIELYNHQKNAVNKWLDNKKKGIFEMATGTGKTYAALGCLNKVLEETSKLITIVSAPYQHLVKQWKKEINKFQIDYNKIFIADSSNLFWKDNLTDSLIDLDLGRINHILVITTHSTFCTDDFKRIIRNNKGDTNILVIGDEVHGLGATKSKEGLLDIYELRLGLSATPKRWFDTVGTKKLYDYFGGVVFEFSLDDAINTINPSTGKTYLTPYRYLPIFVNLEDFEVEEYIEKTASIAIRYSKCQDKEEKDEILENLIFKRADIIKNAAQKFDILKKILDEKNNNIKHTIVYCTPQQIDKVMDIINERDIIAHRFTMEEGTNPKEKYKGLSEREYILENFHQKIYDLLVAMKCLDEGIDIPPAKTAIFMSSSGNPREYIQRLGRVLRRFPGKKEATICDIIVTPSSNAPPELHNVEEKIFKKELKRYIEIAEIAINNVESMEKIYMIK